MSDNTVFSWAQNADGVMVHVDIVPNGRMCNCICPCCKEKLLARHGNVNEHGFAHLSETRRANLKICYMVILYKLAEQIIQTKKKIRCPSYYDIFPEETIEFVDVKIDSSYERVDKQPDVIASTADGTEYIIEFIFDSKVQHKKAIDYKNMNCIEIDLFKQNLDTVEYFLLESSEDRKWLNNQTYFENIESCYRNAGKLVSVKSVSECECCKYFRESCTAVRNKDSFGFLTIENSGNRYRLCKIEEYNKKLESERQKQLEYEAKKQRMLEQNKRAELKTQSILPHERTCFMCERNLAYLDEKDNGLAHCASYPSMRVPQKTPPETAKTCKGFRYKIK